MIDILTVSFERGTKDDCVLCVFRGKDGHSEILKIAIREQADILYRLLTERSTNAEIKGDK